MNAPSTVPATAALAVEARKYGINLGLLLGVVRQLRPVEQVAVVGDRRGFRRLGSRGRGRAGGALGLAERAQHRADAVFDVLQRTHHLGDALAGDVLEVAR